MGYILLIQSENQKKSWQQITEVRIGNTGYHRFAVTLKEIGGSFAREAEKSFSGAPERELIESRLENLYGFERLIR